ncbi:CocE/NonD family hydrolase [Luteimonas terrae]|uniref:CocE/NonD family hydrolase n=1 Tax=Luteimonas terrae TaxID=1530191 RepID=A0ABU1XRV6_9GAMM|nr:CocE/NonD family hydrolase [Luteimonas terrae]MDR7191323.1 putative CocE/NonD family hydrolase [Luteimonas terrae]
MAVLSERVLSAGAAGQVDVPVAGLAQLRIAARQDREAVDAVREVMDDAAAKGDDERARRWVPYLIYVQSRVDRKDRFDQAYAAAFEDYFAGLDDLEANRTQSWFGGDLAHAKADLLAAASRLGNAGPLALDDALGLARRQAFVDVLAAASRTAALIAADENARYIVDEDVLIRTPDGVTLSAVVARSRKAASPLPAAMQFTIYTVPTASRATALQAAARGYAGVVVDARGKRLSTDAIRPYETEVDDASAAVDWIARQSWNDGRVAMYGGSYSGFAAWAATKRMPSALKTIVPYAAAIPGFGLPMENNVFLSANYAWPFYVAGNRLLDDAIYSDRERWQRLPEAWYASGRPYREIDRVDGTPNPSLQRWLSHPAYDSYWQAMVPYGGDFARIDIPVLTITGYYDDGQISALQYFKEHLRHRPDAAHYLLIGPYDHFGAQAPFKPRNVGGYDIDPVAQFDTQDITFQWLDHVLHGGPRPALLRDRVNYQLMGADTWQHAPSLEGAAEATTFHLSGKACGLYHCLAPSATPTAPLVQTVDFADRTTEGHAYYPNPVVRDGIEVESGFAFVSAPFKPPTSVVGTFAGELKVRINKRDFDFSVSLYELMPDGKVMQLSYYVGRASHAHDPARRKLLTPGEWTTVPFERTRMTGRRMDADSRLLVVVDVLKDARHQVNMGTGWDVSDESVADAKEPLVIEWHPDSSIQVPLRRE